MSSNLTWTLIVFGLCVIVLLAWFIRKQIKRLNELKAEQTAIQNQQKQVEVSHRLDLKESIKVISKVMLDDQVDLSEGCLRLKVLIDNLDPALHEDPKFKVFAEFSAKIEHMPTHQARKEIDKKLLRKLDQQRLKLEVQHRDEIRASTTELLEYLKISS